MNTQRRISASRWVTTSTSWSSPFCNLIILVHCDFCNEPTSVFFRALTVSCKLSVVNSWTFLADSVCASCARPSKHACNVSQDLHVYETTDDTARWFVNISALWIHFCRIQMPGSSLLLEYPQLSCLEFYNGIRTTDPEALSTGRLKRPLVDTEEQQVLVAELHYKIWTWERNFGFSGTWLLAQIFIRLCNLDVLLWL